MLVDCFAHSTVYDIEEEGILRNAIFLKIIDFMVGLSCTCISRCTNLMLANSLFPWALKALPVSPRVCFLCTRQFPYSINTGQTCSLMNNLLIMSVSRKGVQTIM